MPSFGAIASIPISDVGDFIATSVVEPVAIPSAEAHGTPQLNLVLALTGIVSAEAFGAIVFALQLDSTGIPSAEALGTPQINLVLQPTPANAGEVMGTPFFKHVLDGNGIPTAEAFGTASLIEMPVPGARLFAIGPPTAISTKG